MNDRDQPLSMFAKSLSRVVDKDAPCDRPKIVLHSSFDDFAFGLIERTTYYCPTEEQYNEFMRLSLDSTTFTDCHRCFYPVKNVVSLQ